MFSNMRKFRFESFEQNKTTWQFKYRVLVYLQVKPGVVHHSMNADKLSSGQTKELQQKMIKLHIKKLTVGYWIKKIPIKY